MEYLKQFSGSYQYEGRNDPENHFCYLLTWEKIDTKKIQRICWGELDERGAYVIHSFRQAAECEEGLSLPAPAVQRLEYHSFFAVGLSHGENFSREALFSMDAEKTQCRIPCICGSLNWELERERHSGRSLLNLRASTDIPGNIVFLCYDYAGVSFSVDLPGIISGGSPVSFPLYFPDEAQNIRLESPVTALTLQCGRPETEQEKKPGFFSRLFGRGKG